jgi:hypothetical protein
MERAMSIQNQLLGDLTLRASELATELASWRKEADSNKAGMGIHQSQFAAIDVMFQERLKLQEERLTAARTAANPADFYEDRLRLERDVEGNQAVMGIFRYIMAQRDDTERYRKALDAADLIAGECYRLCIHRARGFDAIQGDEFREPPLTYLNPRSTPVAHTRAQTFATFNLLPDRLPSELVMPISVIALPFPYAATVWNYCGIYHEVGHPLDQDLRISETLGPTLSAQGFANPEPWQTWLTEIVPDAFGVLLGGVAYAHSLSNLLLGPQDEVMQRSLGPHPTSYVRVFLLGELLREADVPEAETVATQVTDFWASQYSPPASLQPLLAECKQVAKLVLDAPVPGATGGERLREFKAMDAAQHARVQELADFLPAGFFGPSDAESKKYPYRLVPAAAQLAVVAAVEEAAAGDGAKPVAEILREIHGRTMDFVARIEPPQFLGPSGLESARPSGFSAEREQYLRGLARKLRFGPD